MKRLPVPLSVFAAAALAAGAAHADWSPVSFSFIGQYPDSETDVYGLRIGTIAHHRNFAGVSVLLVGNLSDSPDGCADGVQIGCANIAKRTRAFLVQVGALGNEAGSGWTLQLAGLLNQADNADEGGFAIQAAGLANFVEGAGFSVAGLVNSSEHGFTGFEAATFNSVEGAVRGVQIGLANETQQSVCGLQIGGGNEAEDVYGAQIGGINLVGGSVCGLQAGAISLAGGSVCGLQVGAICCTGDSHCQIGGLNLANNVSVAQIGAANFATSVTGLQAGAINKTDSLSGLQLGGANFACEDCDGVQIGGFNLAGRLSGVQIGAVNAALSGCRGAQIGVVNIYAGASSELSALQFGGVNVANESSTVVLPIVRVAF